MKRSLHTTAAFSLVEITLALGVAAFCLIAVMGMLPAGLKTQQGSVNQTKANAIIVQITADLRADVRLPPGQAKTDQFGLNNHWAAVATPDTLYFTNDLEQTGGVNPATVPTNPPAVFRATVTYLFPPTATTSIAKISVSWPAQINPATGVPAGSAEAFVAVNR
jgi:hypothetical protein